MKTGMLERSQALFVRRWGEMGVYWGISRTMAEIHALLFISPAPLCTDDLMEQLEISRGNASMNLRGLVDWGLIHRVHIRGDRKEYFTSDKGVWRMFETIVRQRRRREVEPIVETIGKCREMVEQEIPGLSGEKAQQVREYRERLIEMQEFLETVGSLINVALELGPKGMDQIARMLGMAKA
jgi:DNA-binding transcriptional regulator GbsR (MarR family)